MKNDTQSKGELLGIAVQACAADGTEPQLNSVNIGGQDVVIAAYEANDGSYGESYVCEHAGMLFMIHAMPGCADPDGDDCHEDAVGFMVQFVATSEQTS